MSWARSSLEGRRGGCGFEVDMIGPVLYLFVGFVVWVVFGSVVDIDFDIGMLEVFFLLLDQESRRQSSSVRFAGKGPVVSRCLAV